MNISNIISTMLTKLKTYTDNKVADIKKYPYNWNETNSSNKGYIKNKPTALPANGGNVTKVSGYSIWTGTQSEYNAISSKNDSTLYFITDSSSGGGTNNDLILFGNGQWQNTDISGGFTTNPSYVYISSNNLYFKNVRDLGLCTCSQSKINFSKYKKLSFTVRADTTCTFYVGSYNQSYTSSQSSTFDPKTYNNRQKYNIDSSFTTYEIDISAWTTGYLMFLKTAQSLGPGVYISEIKLIGNTGGGDSSTNVIYNNGTDNLGISTASNWAMDTDNGGWLAMTKSSNSIIITLEGVGAGEYSGHKYLYCKKGINVTDYNKLIITYKFTKGDENIDFVIGSGYDSTLGVTQIDTITLDKSTTGSEMSFNVSGLTGTYYIGAEGWANYSDGESSVLTITGIKLTK